VEGMAETAMENRKNTDSEIFESVIRLLEESRAGLERVLTGVEDDFCSRKPAAGGWSITEIMEHLVIMEERIPRFLQQKLPEQEPSSRTADPRAKDAKLLKRVASSTNRANAPESAKPTGRYHSCRQALDDFGAARQRTLAYVRSAPPYLRNHLLPHPMLGPLDGSQWLLFLAAHTQRHIKQIEGTNTALSCSGGSIR
jgi:DinB superfamily